MKKPLRVARFLGAAQKKDPLKIAKLPKLEMQNLEIVIKLIY
jgi:hypothetical protein